MAGKRRPMDVNLTVLESGQGGKHWTRAEIETREAEELHLPKPEQLKPPKYLSPEAKKLFRGYAKQLLAYPKGIVSDLDVGTLARHCTAEAGFIEYSAQHDTFLGRCRTLRLQYVEAGDVCGLSKDEEYIEAKRQVDYWSGQMARFEKICRGCASEMGLTITSRCRLVVPKSEKKQEDDPLEALRRKFLSG